MAEPGLGVRLKRVSVREHTDQLATERRTGSSSVDRCCCRHWNDDDETGFPYKHCGALAVAEKKQTERPTPWGVNSAETRRKAEDLALQACEAAGDKCKIREWVCT